MYEYEHSPLARILELGKLADFDKVTSNCAYFMLFKNNSLPKVPQSTISLIQENHQSKEKMSEILYNISFPFPVMTQSILDISRDLEKMSENNKIYSSIFLLYSFFAWFINFTKTGLVYPGDIVLSSLLNVKIDSSQNFEILAKSAFFFGYKSVIESKTTPLFDKYIPTAKGYFLGNNETKKYPNLIPIVSGILFVDILSHFEYPDKTTNEPVELSKDLFEIVDMICESAILHPYIFNEDIIFSIIEFLKSYMCANTEINSSKIIIKCFSNLLKLTNSDYSFIISNNIAPAILCMINQCLKDLSLKNITEYDNKNDNFNLPKQLVTLPKNLEIIQDFKYPETQTFSKGFNSKPLKNVVVENETENLFNNLIDQFSNFIQSLFYNENNIKTFVSAILANFDSIEDVNETNHIAFFLLFILFIINQRKKDNIKSTIKYIDLIRPIMNSFDNKIEILFNPKVTILSNDQEIFSEELNTIRNEFLKNIIQRKKQLHKFLTNCRLYPLLFTEIIYRLTALNIRIPLDFLNEIMLFYRFMNISNIETLLAEIARESMFNYLSVVYFDYMFDGVNVQTSYFLCLMEDNLFDEIIKIFRNYFEHAGTVIDSKSFALFLKLFHINSVNDHSNVIKVMIRFVKLLLSIFQTKISFSRSFKSSYLELFNILSEVKITEELLQLVLSLFIFISQEYELSDIEAFHLKKSILNIYSSSKEINDSESFFSSILKLISIDNLHIYNPKVLHIAYLLFSSIKFDEFIENFLYLNLLTKSPHAIDNCKKCHLAGFDCFLLDELSNLKKQDYSVQKENQIKKILCVFETISKYFSSPTAVLKFTSLLSPKNGKVLSKYMPLFMNSLSQLVEVDYCKKTKHMKLDEYCGDFIVPKSFSICFWISCRSFDSAENMNLNIFTANSLKKDTNDIIKIYISNNNNELKIEINGIVASCIIKKDEWTFITISFTKKSINIYVNLSLLSIFYTSKLNSNSHFSGQDSNDDYAEFSGKIGYASTDVSKENIELGFFGVLNHLSFDEMKKLYHNGVFSYPANPIFAYNLSNHPTVADTTTLADLSLISNKSASIVFNFIFCLTKIWKCDILIPLYSILNIPFENDDQNQTDVIYYTELPYITTHIITKCLISNLKLQTYFYETNKIGIIAYLLYQMSICMHPNIIIDLRLYQYFYKMCLCISNNELHTQIYFSIIANLKLINQTNPNDHSKILESWLSDVHKIPHFAQIGSFSVLLSLMNIFYKYEEINQNKIEDNKIDIDKIKKEIEINNNQASSKREIFHNLLFFAADQSFELSDYYEIVNQCNDLFHKYIKYQKNDEIKQSSSLIVRNHIKEISDMLRFLNLLVRQSSVAFKNMKITINDVLMLNELIVSDKNYINEKIVVCLFDTITSFYKQEIFDDSQNLSAHYGLIIRNLSDIKLTSRFLKRLIHHANKFSPELYLICCWFLATNSPNDEELQNLFVSSLLSSFCSLSKNVLSDHFYLIWSCLLANHLISEKLLRIFFAFIINILYDNWHLMLQAISLFSKSVDSTIMLYLDLTSEILFDKYKNINYLMDEMKNSKKMTLKSSSTKKQISYISPKRRSSLNSYFLSSSSSSFDVNAFENSNNNNTDNSGINDKEYIQRFYRKSLSEKELSVYIQLAVFFIFNRPKSVKITPLEKIFIQSPFMNKEYEILQSENDSSLQMFMNKSNENNTKKKESKDAFNYGLRFDDDMNWIDFEFAKTIFNMRMNLKLHLVSKETTAINQNEVKLFTILLYFISHYDPQFSESLIVKINQYQSKNYSILNPSVTIDSLIKSIFIHFDIKKITGEVFSDFYDCSLSFLNEIRSNFVQYQTTLSNNFKSLSAKIDELSSLQTKVLKDTFYTNPKELTPLSSFNSCEYGIKKLKKFMILLEDYDRLKWEELRKNLVVEKGPWNIGVDDSFYFKRSMILCSNFCPFLMKRTPKEKNQKTKKHYSIDSDFYFWTYNHFLPSSEQIKFLNSYLNENPYSDKSILYDCILQKIDKFISCKLKIEPNSISIIIQEKVENDDEIELVPNVTSINKNDVSIIISKIIQGEPEKIEIFTNLCSKSYLLNCDNSNEIIDSYINICNPQPENVLVIKNHRNTPSESFSTFIQNIQTKWADKKISNFEYIMILNIFAGRSFNDIGQYPIFPWILKDYKSEKIDINDESIYRQFIKNEEVENNLNDSFCILTPSAVSCYLQRISPFNDISEKCQFFNSSQSTIEKKKNILTNIKDQFELLISQQQEITPEFFFMPEFLIGKKEQNLSDVILPNWCNSPTDFIYIHRKALESEFISRNINNWIDLVFGCRQNEFGKQKNKEDELSDESSSSLFLTLRKEGLPFRIFTSSHIKQTTEIKSKGEKDQIGNETQSHHYIIKSQNGMETVIYAYFEGENLFVFDSSLNVSKFSFNFDNFELSFVEKKSIMQPGSNDISLYPEFGFCLKYSSFVSQKEKRQIIAHNNLDLNGFYLIEIDSLFNFAIKKYHLDMSNGKQKNESNSIRLNGPDKEMTLLKIECADGNFIVVSYSDELHLAILELIDNEKEKDNESNGIYNNYVIRRYSQFIAVPKCCAISSIFKTFIVATDDGSMQIASINGQSSNQWNLSKIVEFKQSQNDENIFVPQKILITDSLGLIVVYGKMKMSFDENESFIYVFTINGIFIRSQKIDGEVVNWTKWKSKRGFDFLTLVIKKKTDGSDENTSLNNNNIDDIDNDDASTSTQKSFSISYKIAICEAFYLNLDILKYRFTEKVVSIEYLIDKNLLAIFQSDGNCILEKYDPNDLYIE